MSTEHPSHNQECKSDEHTKHLCYFVSYGYHVDNPEEYKDLVVKVGGFSVYFTEIGWELQNEIISRTEHATW